MKEYEITLKYCNACGGTAHPQTSFEEAELANTDDYIRRKHSKDFHLFTKEVLSSGQIVYKFDNGSVMYTYEFTEL